jgi:hypothetical protein
VDSQASRERQKYDAGSLRAEQEVMGHVSSSSGKWKKYEATKDLGRSSARLRTFRGVFQPRAWLKRAPVTTANHFTGLLD